jgi:hypothetical protein
MRASVLMMALLLAFGCEACRHSNLGNSSGGAQNFAALSGPSTASDASTTTKPDFETQVKPIFQARCQPCHFLGGKVYDKMPFDKPETITRLGEKLFTRIKDEKEQRLIREFLSQP